MRTKSGGMGIVLICDDLDQRRRIALKTFQHKFLADEIIRQRFLREASLWIQLGYHPNIVHAESIQRLDGDLFILMECIEATLGLEAPNLRSWMKTRRLSPATILDFAYQISAGMAHAASVIPNIIHRDLKPENVLIALDILVKVTDFGLVKVHSRSELDTPTDRHSESKDRPPSILSSPENVVGTPFYVAPEVWRANANIRPSADVYSFGCILFEMITGDVAFPGRTLTEVATAHISHIPVLPPEAESKFPPEVNEILCRCLHKSPAHRYQTFDEMGYILGSLYSLVAGRTHPIAALWTETEANVTAKIPAEHWSADYDNRSRSLYEAGRYIEAENLARLALTLITGAC